MTPPSERREHPPSRAEEIRGAIERTRERMHRVYSDNQVLGRARSIGCTALEITQRCNLDCTLCYLSESSESVRDLPFEEVLRRLDEIRHTFGPSVPVQITGGDPTLRKHHELIAIVRHARTIGLYPALFTNGIAAPRKLLIALKEAGLCDVAFHVDTTQQRKGYASEAALNAVRLEYLERARGLGLMVVFNTTVHEGNFHEIPALVEFFVAHAEVIGFASFQLQAETGRGEWRKRAPLISVASVQSQIDRGAGRDLPWDVVRVGHPLCHRYAPTFIVNGRVYPVIEDADLLAAFLRDFTDVQRDKWSPRLDWILRFARAGLAHPQWLSRGLRYAATQIWRARGDLIAARLRVRKLSFFVHNFMDANDLDPERIEACSFMIMTAEGPVSMCAHNARRDDYILKPISIARGDGVRVEFQPLAPPRRKRRRARRAPARETSR